MEYKNPLSVFSSKQIDKILSGDYKSVKKEILLQFQLEEGITINLNGRDLDKNAILKIFESLDEDAQLHAAIYQQKSLLRFLEEGELGFFDHQINFDKLKSSPFREDIDQLVIAKTDSYLGLRLRKFNPKNVSILQRISNYTKLLPEQKQTSAYIKAYQSLLTYMDQLTKLVPDPFENDKLLFKRSVSKLVNMDQLEFFRYLPESFENLKMQYILWCNDHVLLPALTRESSLSSYSKTDLLTIQRAAIISATEFNKENNLEIANTISRYLKGRKKRRFFAIALFVAFFIFLNTSDDKKPKVPTIEDPDYIHTLEKVVSQNEMTSAQPVDIKTFFGLAEPVVNKGDTLVISYDCEHLPFTSRWTKQLITDAIKDTIADKQIIKLILQDEDNSAGRLTYSLEYDKDTDYFKVSSTENTDSIKINNLLEENETIDVIYSRETGPKFKKTTKFKLKHLEDEMFQIWTYGDIKTEKIDYKNLETIGETIVTKEMLLAVIRNNIGGPIITMKNSVEIIDDQYYYNVINPKKMTNVDIYATARFRKLEGLNQDAIKVIGKNHRSMMLLDQSGQTIHKQTILRTGSHIDIIKIIPVSVSQ